MSSDPSINTLNNSFASGTSRAASSKELLHDLKPTLECFDQQLEFLSRWQTANQIALVETLVARLPEDLNFTLRATPSMCIAGMNVCLLASDARCPLF